MEELLQIDLLGTFRLRYKGEPVSDFNSPRLQELLAYLVLHGDAPQQRHQIAIDFWPESPEKQTLANLRQLLYQLRNSFPDSERYILPDTNTIQWKPEASCHIDVAEFGQLLEESWRAKSTNDTEAELEALEAAVPLYRGPLLSHCFEDWITGERNRLKKAYTGALERIIDVLEEERDYKAALTYAGKLQEHDPCSESACRKIIQLHALNEDRTAVIRTYQAFKKKIQRELEIEPGPQTKELYQRLSESFKRDSAESTSPPVLTAGNGKDTGWPMVGRTEEWKSLIKAWDEARSGTMQWVLIRGETGIGKSRLGGELQAYLSKKGYAGAQARCYEAPGTPGYGPVADWLRSPSLSSRIAKLDEVWLDELSRLLPEFSGRLQNTPDPEPWQQRRFEEAIAHAVLADGKPTLLLLDELQWCDSETLGWLDFIFNRDQPTPLLVAATLRTTAGNPYGSEALEGLLADLRRKHCLRVIEPGPLDRSQTLELASKILKHEIGDSMGALLYRETEGNPLFIVETARELHLLEQLKNKNEDKFIPPDQTPSQVRKLPRVVTEVISGRFRYLSSKSREVLGIAAAAGRDFSFILIARSCDMTEGELVDALEELIRQHILREVRPEYYDFTHDKLREVAYKELSATRRRRHHLRIAEALLEIHVDEPASWYGRLAFHYERAGETESALDYYLKAALHARNVTSLQDVGMLRRALKLLDTLPEGSEHARREFDLTASLAMSYLQRRRFDTDEVFRLCERVYELCSELREPPPIGIVFMLGIAKLMSGDSATAVELGFVMHTLAGETGDTVAEVEACYLLGLSNRIKGNISESVRWYREGLGRYEEGIFLPRMRIYDLDGGIILRMEAATGMLLADLEEEARQLLKSASEAARASELRYGDAYVCYATAWFETLTGNGKKVRKAAEQFLECGIEAEPMHWSVQVEILLGWSMAAQGYPERGIERIQRGIDRLEELNYTLDLPFYYVLFAESLIAAEAYSEAGKAINRAKDLAERTGARFFEAEILRMEGELLLAKDPQEPDVARDFFKKAAETARQQGAYLFERHASDALDRIG